MQATRSVKKPHWNFPAFSLYTKRGDSKQLWLLVCTKWVLDYIRSLLLWHNRVSNEQKQKIDKTKLTFLRYDCNSIMSLLNFHGLTILLLLIMYALIARLLSTEIVLPMASHFSAGRYRGFPRSWKLNSYALIIYTCAHA